MGTQLTSKKYSDISVVMQDVKETTEVKQNKFSITIFNHPPPPPPTVHPTPKMQITRNFTQRLI